MYGLPVPANASIAASTTAESSSALVSSPAVASSQARGGRLARARPTHVLTELQEHDHEVIALVRDGAQADIVADRGATPIVIDLYDGAALVRLLRNADGAIHTATTAVR